MTYEEIYKLVQYNDYKEYESKLFMPNEIFSDLKANIKNTPHIAFAYSYYYLISWLYRYCKYHLEGGISNSTIKQILGYKPETRTVNYLITKNGLLDKMDYTQTERDFPINTVFDNYLDFEMVSEIDNKEDKLYSYEMSMEKIIRESIPKNFTVKFPVKGFYRSKESEEDCYQDGTFHEVDNTHLIPFEVFMYCMGNENIGCTGFYLYAYLKHKNDSYEGGYDISLPALSAETGIAERTLDKYLNMLKGYRLIDFQHNQDFFAVGLREEDRKANTYITRKFETFSDEIIPFHKINIMSKKDYFKMLEEQEKEELERILSNKVDIPLEELPY